MYVQRKIPSNKTLYKKEPVAQNWVSSDYHKIEFRDPVLQIILERSRTVQSSVGLLSGEVRQEQRGESITKHYVRYASLAANLQPPLRAYDSVTALTSHFSLEIRRNSVH